MFTQRAVHGSHRSHSGHPSVAPAKRFTSTGAPGELIRQLEKAGSWVGCQDSPPLDSAGARPLREHPRRAGARAKFTQLTLLQALLSVPRAGQRLARPALLETCRGLVTDE